jgi:pimeloyl-ACP methyl ester carboxylesterase
MREGWQGWQRAAALVVACVVAAVAVPALASGAPAAVPERAPIGTDPTAAGTDPTAAGTRPTAAGAAPVHWFPCQRDKQCARLRVPLNSAQPHGRTISLSLIRARATGPGKRVGSLLINPGGPGESTVAAFSVLLGLLSPTLRQRFDVVGFDPRGVGESAPVRCVDGAELDRILRADPTPRTPGGIATLLAVDAAFAAACVRRSGDLLPYVGTRDAARDMDRIRAALDEPRLSYLGFSYGTLLGVRYAEQFPDRVRALVLDGAIDPAVPPLEVSARQAVGFQRALLAFLADCGARQCAWRPRGPLLQAYRALIHRIRLRPLKGEGGRTVGPGLALFGVLATLYNRPVGWPLLAHALAAAERGDGRILLRLADLFAEREKDGRYTNAQEANTAVNCRDAAWPTDVTAYTAAADDAARRAPDFGRAAMTMAITCAFWPVRGPRAVPAHTTTTRPIVVVGSTGDPATPYAQARALARQLPHGVLVTRVGEGHTGYVYSACVRRAVDAYLVDLDVPGRSTRCGS